jgi:hypothetical protein
LLRINRDVTCYVHAREFLASAWAGAAAKSRVSMIETLSVELPVLTRDLAREPEPEVLRHALRQALNQNEHARPPGRDEARALAWLQRASRPIASLEDPSVVCDVLDALATRLDGTPRRRSTSRGGAG